MRFQLTPGGAVRLGRLFATPSSELAVDTPGCFLYTRYASVPFLPPDLYEDIQLLPRIACIPMFYVAERKLAFKKFKKGITAFSGLCGMAAFVYQTDSVEPAPVQAADRHSVPVWATGGRIQLSVGEYVDCVQIAVPSAYQLPTDNETSLLVSLKTRRAKRCTNSVLRTRGYLDKVSAIVNENQNLAKIPRFASIAGGNDLNWRLESIKQTDFSVVSGVVLDGFLHPLPSVSTTDSKTEMNDPLRDETTDLFNILPDVCANLPAHLPRFLTGVWQLPDIARASQIGIDLFDGSLPYRLTRSAVAWIYSDWKPEASTGLPSPFYLAFPLILCDDTAVFSEEDCRKPIQADCQCFACTHHTRVYISHLHTAKEMLGPMLLMIHNSHQYYRFFTDLRKAFGNNQMKEFVEFAEHWRFPLGLLDTDKTFESKTTN